MRVFMVTRAGIQRSLNDLQQHLNERILQAVKLVCDEANQMQIAVILGPLSDLESASFEDGIGIISQPFLGKIQRDNNQGHVIVEQPERLPIFQGRFNLRGFCRLGNLLKECQLEALDLGRRCRRRLWLIQERFKKFTQL